MTTNKNILAAKLKHRLEICTPTQDPNDTLGSFNRGYTTIKTVWGGILTLSDWQQYIRGQHTGEKDTHEFIVRYSAIKNVGNEFNSAFAEAFSSMSQLIPLKVQYFIKLRRTSTKKRVFRITGVKIDEDCLAWVKIRAIEIEEQGTGWPV